jgi:hypothetical protein
MMRTWPRRIGAFAVAIVVVLLLILNFGNRDDIDSLYHSRIMNPDWTKDTGNWRVIDHEHQC